MRLNSNILDKLMNSDYIKNIYPMIDHIDTHVSFNERHPAYYIDLKVYLNDPTINNENMYDKEFDPHYLSEYHLKYLVNFLRID